jgi:hypothetical protein
MYFVGLLIKVGSFWLASQLELARYTTEQKPKLRSFKNSNEPSRVELLTSEFASFEFFVQPYMHATDFHASFRHERDATMAVSATRDGLLASLLLP